MVLIPKGSKITEPVTLDNCENCTLEDIDFDLSKMPAGKKALYVKNGKGNKFINLRFHGRRTGGVIMCLDGPRTKDNELVNIEWRDIETKEKNGAEPLRLGNSTVSHCWFQTYCKDLKFYGIRTTEPELVSIKSCGNTLEDGIVEDCTGMVTVRHGHSNTIKSWAFSGQGGIRVYGKNNAIEENIHKDNQSSAYPPLAVVNGNTLVDPNEKAGLDTDQQAQDGHATYTQAKNGHVSNCTFVDCSKAIVWGRDKNPKTKYPFTPIGVKVMGNTFKGLKRKTVAVSFEGGSSSAKNFFSDNFYDGKVEIPKSIEEGFSKAQSATTSDPIITEDDLEMSAPTNPNEESGVVGASPDPVEQPVEEEEGQVCQACGKQDAKSKMSLYFCSEDINSPELINQVNKLWGQIKQKIASGEISLGTQIEEQEIEQAKE